MLKLLDEGKQSKNSVDRISDRDNNNSFQEAQLLQRNSTSAQVCLSRLVNWPYNHWTPQNCCTTIEQWWKQDQNVKTKTKTKTIRSRPRPRPVWDRSCH